MPAVLFRAVFFLLLAVISVLALTPDTGAVPTLGWDKLNHLAAFFTLAVFFQLAFPRSPGMIMKLSALFLFGVGIEVVQSFHPLRDASMLDLLANTLGLLLFLLVLPILKQFQQSRYFQS